MNSMYKTYVYCLIILGLLGMSSCKDSGGNGGNTNFPVLSIADAEFVEGDDNNTVSITVALTGDNETNVLVSYSTIQGTAASGADFINVPDGELVIGPNDTEGTIDIAIKGDEINEPDETFEILIFNPSNATVSRDRATITITNDDDTSDNFIPSSGYTTPITYPGKSLVWADEFQGNSLNTMDWTHEIGNGASGWGNNELQYYQAANTSIYDNEYLVIEAKNQNVGGFNYTSSRMITKNKREFKYGRIDIRAALPEGRGLWPALWMLGENIDQVSWPACGEIDIMELVGHSPSQVHGTVHYGNSNALHEYTGSSVITSDGSKYSEEFHVFSIDWQENLIKFYVDDALYLEIDPSDMEN